MKLPHQPLSLFSKGGAWSALSRWHLPRLSLTVGASLILAAPEYGYAIDHEGSLSAYTSGVSLEQQGNTRVFGSILGAELGYSAFVGPSLGIGLLYAAQFGPRGVQSQALSLGGEISLWGQRPLQRSAAKLKFSLDQPFEVRLMAGAGFRTFDITYLEDAKELRQKSDEKFQGNAVGFVSGLNMLASVTSEYRAKISPVFFVGPISESKSSRFVQVSLSLGFVRSL